MRGIGRRHPVRRSERGQATTETLLLAWIAVAFLATVIQLFLANDAIFKSVTAVHRELFAKGFPNNCADYDNSDCRYGDIQVVWKTGDFPETRVPILPVFQRLRNLSPEYTIQNDDGTPKQTTMAAGPAGPGTPHWYPTAADLRLAEKALWATSKLFEVLAAAADRYTG
jgi:hypothetical protein